MVQITEQDLTTLKELINSRFDLTDQKIQVVSEKLDLVKERVERLEKNDDKISTAIIVAMLSILIAGLVKWVLPSANHLVG